MRNGDGRSSVVIAVPVADESGPTLLVGGPPRAPSIPEDDPGSNTSPLRIGKGLPARRRTEDTDPASTGDRWRLSGERSAARDDRPSPVPSMSAPPSLERHRPSGERAAVRDDPPVPATGEPRRPSGSGPAIPADAPVMPSSEWRRRASDERPAVQQDVPAMASAERSGPVAWERRVGHDRRRTPQPGERSVMMSGERRGRRADDPPAFSEERMRRTPAEWAARADEPPGMSSAERRRSSGERSRRTSDAWSSRAGEAWSPAPDEWPPQDSDERPMSRSLALRRWSPPGGTSSWDEARPRWRVGSRHRLRHRSRRRRLPVSLLVGLATVLGGGMGAAGLLTWEAVAAPTGTLVVDNLPRDASVLVDSRPADRQVIQLSPGTHQLEILAPGMESHRELVKITANTTVRIRAPQAPLPAADPPGND
jgi:hypothetical protein